jgi:hypothetical protein
MLGHFKNKFTDQTCLIIGNGPSLRNIPDYFLDKYTTFGSNKIFMRYTPTFYTAVNKLVIEQNRTPITRLKSEKFLPRGTGIPCHELSITRVKKFCYDVVNEIYEGYTVTFVSLQLAYFMGFTTVGLVGVDHKYKFDGKPNEVHLMSKDDPNHFDSEYFKGQLWNNPDLMQSEASYTMAEIAYTEHGRKIINLTEGTELNVFEKGDIKEW